MKNKVLKVAIALLLIIVMTMSDFVLVGMNLVTYALENLGNSTNNSNVNFVSYFKTEEGEKVSKTQYEMNNNEMKLYLEVGVKNEGYFDGVVTLENSNFKLKQSKTSEHISKIEGNTITLNRVRAGNTAQIEVGIEPIIEENYEKNMLNKESVVKLSGTYKDSSEKDITIESSKKVTLDLIVPKNIETALKGEVITNTIYKIGEANKRIVQIELTSEVLENAYPIDTTMFELQLPEGVEKVEVISQGTYATNGKAEKNLEGNFEIDNNRLYINIENTNNQGIISWKKDAKDTIIATIILPENQQITEKEFTAKAQIQFQGQAQLEKSITYNLNETADGIIRASVENKEIIYKGKIYSKEEREFNTTTNIEANYADLVKSSTIQEKTTYRTEKESEDKTTNIQYKTTTIAKSDFDKVLGTGGILTIKDQNGALVKEIKATDFDTTGKLTITYAEGVKGITINITEAVGTGIIKLNHTKVIKPENYTKEEISQINYLIEQADVEYKPTENSKASYSFEARKTLGETQTVAELTLIDKQTLSTATLNEDVEMAITLKTDSEQYDLYKNPTLTIKLPNAITKVSNITVDKQNLDSFTINTQYYPETKEIKIALKGEQTQYNGSNSNGYIVISSDIELEEITPKHQDEITLTYTNEKAISYKNEGKASVPVNISGYGGLVAFNKITNYNIKTNSKNSEEQIGNLKMNQDATEANFQTILVNNTESDLNNVTVLGNLPVEGNITIGSYTFQNTVPASLKAGINVPNGATVYYTANKNATKELENGQNGWTTNLAEVEKPILYMIVISKIAKGANFTANYTMNIPANLQHDKDMRTTYTVNYSAETKATINAIPVGLETGKVVVNLEAKVGTEPLEDNATVKTGEIIKYKITVNNTGSNDVTNVNVKALVPEGTTYIKLVDDIDDSGSGEAFGLNYEEDESKKEETQVIDVLKAGEVKNIEYEVIVKKDATAKTITNQATVIYNGDIEVKSNIKENKLEQGNLKVRIERKTSLDVVLKPNEGMQYLVTVENISNIELKDVELEIQLPDEFSMVNIEKVLDAQTETDTDTSSEIKQNGVKISNISANEVKQYMVYVLVEEVEELSKEVSISVLAKVDNKTYKSNVYNENIYGFDIDMEWEVTSEGQRLNPGDLIEYKIKVTNNSNIPLSQHYINMQVANQLRVTEIIGVEEQNVTDENVVNIELSLDAKQTKEITIKAIVKYDPTRVKLVTISTYATLTHKGIEKYKLPTVVHYLEPVIEEEGKQDPETTPTDPQGPPPVKEPEEVEPENPDDPDNPSDPENPDNPNNPDDPEKPSDPIKNKYSISGKAWVDKNKDGELNGEDTILEGIKVKLLNIDTNKFVKTSDEKEDLIIETSKNGDYIFENIIEGNYIVVFEYDNTLYKPTVYEKSGIAENNNSNVLVKTLIIDGQTQECATTNKIELNKNITNINIGLVFIKQFDIKLDKYISKVIVQTSKGTTTYDYKDKDFAKVEIHSKTIIGSSLIVQYTIRATNTGDVDAYISSLVDYVPEGLKFSSELNKDWYETKGNLYTNTLENTPIAPGESKEVNLILTKTKSDGNAELINNMAEIDQAYNIYGIGDSNSNQANKNKDENDIGSVDLLISIQTGTMFNYISVVISMLGVIGVATYLINKKILHISLKGRR